MKSLRMVVLTLILIMTTSFTVFAEDTVTTTVTGTDTTVTGTTTVTEDNDTTAETTEEESIGSVVQLNVPYVLKSEYYTEQLNKSATALQVAETGSYYEVTAKRDGFLYFTITADSNNKNAVNCQKRTAKNVKIADITTALKAGSSKTVMIPVVGNKTYHFYMNNAAVGDKFYAKGFVVLGQKSRSLTINDSRYSVASGPIYDSSSTTTYWKVKVTKTGLMTVNVSDIWNSTPKSVKVTLLNSKKKEISAKTTVTGKVSDDSVTFSNVAYGVTSGTYYVKVTTSVPLYGIKITKDNTYNNKGYTSKKKAYKIKSGVDRKSVLNASRSSQAHYYKFVLSKKSTIPVTIKTIASANTSVKIQLIKSNGTVIGTGVVKGKSPAVRNSIKSVNWIDKKTKGQLKLAKGTYYIKISKYSKKSSAAYEISYDN